MDKIRYIHIILVTGISCFVSSCADLYTKPTDFVTSNMFYTNQTECEYALAAVYNTFREQVLYGGGDALNSMFDATDQMWSSYVDSPAAFNYVASDSRVNSIWQYLYRGIERANILLERLDGVVMNDSARTVIRGETKFMRAYYYFLLVQNWGGVPLKLSSTASVNDIYYKRNTAEEVYDFVYSEMKEAADMVRPVHAMKQAGSVSRSAAWGILARVCLHMAGFPNNTTKSAEQVRQNYTDALYWAEKVINNPSFTHRLNPDYQEIFINLIQDKYDLRESIWEVEFYCKGASDYYAAELSGSLGVNNGVTQSATEYGFSAPQYRPIPELFLMFEYNNRYKDIRRDVSITNYRYRTNGTDNLGPDKVPIEEFYPGEGNKTRYTERQIRKYSREFEAIPNNQKIKNNNATNFPLLRYSDVLLMAAEAENELNGPTAKAYDYLNQVRNRAQASPRQGLSKDGFLKAIQEERHLEFCYEGQRRTDLIRWGILLERLRSLVNFTNAGPQGYVPTNGNDPLPVELTGTWDSRVGTTGRNVSEKYFYLPIPSRELSLNNQLVQNPGW